MWESILKGAKYFIEDGSQNYFIFQPLLKYFQASRTSVEVKVMACTSNGLSNEIVKPPATSDNSFSTKLHYFKNPKFRVNFNVSCLTSNRVFTPIK